MDAFLLWSVIAVFALQLIAAFFSLAETALLSLTRSQIAEIKENAEENLSALRLTKLLADPHRAARLLRHAFVHVDVLRVVAVGVDDEKILEAVEFHVEKGHGPRPVGGGHSCEAGEVRIGAVASIHIQRVLPDLLAIPGFTGFIRWGIRCDR